MNTFEIESLASLQKSNILKIHQNIQISMTASSKLLEYLVAAALELFLKERLIKNKWFLISSVVILENS